MQVESVEILIDFTRTVGLATTIAGITILIGSIFLSPYQQVTAIKISGLSIGSGLLLTGAAVPLGVDTSVDATLDAPTDDSVDNGVDSPVVGSTVAMNLSTTSKKSAPSRRF